MTTEGRGHSAPQDPRDAVWDRIHEVDHRSLEHARVFRSWGRARYVLRVGLGRMSPVIACGAILLGGWLFPNWDPPFGETIASRPVRWISALLLVSVLLGLLAALRAWATYERTWFKMLDDEPDTR